MICNMWDQWQPTTWCFPIHWECLPRHSSYHLDKSNIKFDFVYLLLWTQIWVSFIPLESGWQALWFDANFIQIMPLLVLRLLPCYWYLFKYPPRSILPTKRFWIAKSPLSQLESEEIFPSLFPSPSIEIYLDAFFRSPHECTPPKVLTHPKHYLFLHQTNFQLLAWKTDTSFAIIYKPYMTQTTPHLPRVYGTHYLGKDYIIKTNTSTIHTKRPQTSLLHFEVMENTSSVLNLLAMHDLKIVAITSYYL